MDRDNESIGEVAHGNRRVISIAEGFGGLYRVLVSLPGRAMEYISLAPGVSLQLGDSVRVFDTPNSTSSDETTVPPPPPPPGPPAPVNFRLEAGNDPADAFVVLFDSPEIVSIYSANGNGLPSGVGSLLAAGIDSGSEITGLTASTLYHFAARRAPDGAFAYASGTTEAPETFYLLDGSGNRLLASDGAHDGKFLVHSGVTTVANVNIYDYLNSLDAATVSTGGKLPMLQSGVVKTITPEVLLGEEEPEPDGTTCLLAIPLTLGVQTAEITLAEGEERWYVVSADQKASFTHVDAYYLYEGGTDITNNSDCKQYSGVDCDNLTEQGTWDNAHIWGTGDNQYIKLVGPVGGSDGYLTVNGSPSNTGATCPAALVGVFGVEYPVDLAEGEELWIKYTHPNDGERDLLEVYTPGGGSVGADAYSGPDCDTLTRDASQFNEPSWTFGEGPRWIKLTALVGTVTGSVRLDSSLV